MDSKASPKRSLPELQVIAKRPVGSHLRDLLSLASPRQWWGVSSLSRIPVWSVVRPSLVQIFFPAMLYKLLHIASANFFRIGSTVQLPAPRRLLVPYLLSPWTLVFAWRALKPLRQISVSSREFRNKRAIVHEAAWECLADRIETQRAYRSYSYDVYLPGNTAPPEKAGAAILLFPGAGVPHEAYALPAAGLSDAGYLTVVVGMEPHLLATGGLGADATRIRRIQRQVEGKHHSMSHWALCGHSLGSFAAAQLARPLGVERVIMWGSAPFVDYIPDDLSTTTGAPIRVLVVQASKDFLLKMVGTPELTAAFWEKLPSDARKHEVFGGTHAGFASYTSTSNEEEGDISTTEQHREVVRETVHFLREHC